VTTAEISRLNHELANRPTRRLLEAELRHENSKGVRIASREWLSHRIRVNALKDHIAALEF